ncbi:hypothetical protein Pan216_33890 [Planctomycetes bacterium Pan216]|uniref:Outer membrane lipoprotein-sorting protein n=1 Tax=Kolteria novifilia TaxID=2527975 RepID=A0A518B6F8_9BACT|nr:hypothetical protein Pan216_33890 [Planctomycetes bacterium Pan216]
MRKTSAALLMLLAVIAGCSSVRPRATTIKQNKPPSDPEVAQIVAKINENATKIKSLQCNHVDINGSSEGQVYTLNAKMAYQDDHRFRLLGRFAGHSELDLGSNENEIWFWVARMKPPTVFVCNREDLSRVKLAIPFQPDWIMDILGVSPIDREENTLEQSQASQFTLLAEESTPGGSTVIRRTYIDRDSGRISGYELFDDNYNRIVRAHVVEYHDDTSLGIYVPRKVKLEWPEVDTKLTVSLRSRQIEINKITSDFAANVFRRSEYDNTKVVDLANPTASGRGIGMSGYRGPASAENLTARTPVQLRGAIEPAPTDPVVR